MELYNGDCLEIMKEMPSESVELVLTDPPYNIGKSKEWDRIPNYIEWCMDWLKECLRVLSPHGTLIFWHNDMVQISHLICELLKEKDVIYNSTGIWYKPNFRSIAWKNKNGNTTQRSWFNVCEYFQVFTKCKTDKPGQTGWKQVKLDVNNFQNLRKYAFDMLVWIGKNANFAGGGTIVLNKSKRTSEAEKQSIFSTVARRSIFSEVGGRADHFTRYGTTQWELCTPETYEVLTKTYNLREWEKYREYEDLRQEYEDLRPRFNTEKGDGVSNVFLSSWNNTANKSLHPCQKPLDITKKLIQTHSNRGEKVLDMFMGSGTTGVACVNAGRDFIGVEKDEKYFKIAKERIETAKAVFFDAQKL